MPKKQLADYTDRELLEIVLTSQTFILQKLARIEHRIENQGQKTDAYSHEHLKQHLTKLEDLVYELNSQIGKDGAGKTAY